MDKLSLIICVRKFLGLRFLGKENKLTTVLMRKKRKKRKNKNKITMVNYKVIINESS